MNNRNVGRNKYWFAVIFLLIAVFSASGSSAKDVSKEFPTTKPEAVGFSVDRLNRIDSVLKADVDKGQINGAVLLVARKGKIAYFKNFGYRDEGKKQPMEKDSLFRVFSMSKSVTAVAASILLEQGKFLLSDPVAKYIPSFKNILVGEIKINEWGKEVLTKVKPDKVMTIQDLLRHTSGLSYFFWPYPKTIQELYMKEGMDNLTDFTNAEVAEKLAKLPLVSHPGSQYFYGSSYEVLGRVLEVISGLSLDKLFDEYIFDPLKMKDTGFQVKGKDVGRLVYLDPKWPLYSDPTKSQKFLSAGSGLVSTAMDYARFAQMLLDGGQLDGKRILGPKTVTFMTADQLGPKGNRDDDLYIPGRGHGVGFDFYVRVTAGNAYFLGNVGEYEKGGAAGTIFWVDPKEDLIAVFMVNTPTLREHYRFLIKSLIYQAIVK